MTGDIAVLCNPEAGRGRHRDLLAPVLDRLAEADLPVRLLDARTREEAQAACHSAVAGGAAALVAVGGDGTVHLALQAVAGTDVPFGAVPAGTGNDFAVETGVPAEPIAAAAAIAGAIKAARTRPIDLARLTGPGRAPMWYGAVLAAGFDAVVNERANRMRWPRGPRRYDLAIFVELLRLKARRYTLRLDGEEQVRRAVLLAVGNCASYGGGIRIVPSAVPTDGLLDVVLGDVSRATLVRLKGKTYKGTHVEHPQVHTYRARTVEIEAEGITTYADGERAFPLPVTITAVPGAVRLLT
ncbi:diacylglycerol kinase family protein [Phytohabitans houttuyneae]|uniref:Diacylglycerol kinase n=1 Tax=Phytohabitans houttuyneae TaxID=1076126 RepID=A0A6V8KL31_9ACTN|nr:diacylglycerol kinase family protein [Phytohabitans houttuyneae]GFJ83218.1 diacylglycerol kinase [Phytohabitans houttuyneae]